MLKRYLSASKCNGARSNLVPPLSYGWTWCLPFLLSREGRENLCPQGIYLVKTKGDSGLMRASKTVLSNIFKKI